MIRVSGATHARVVVDDRPNVLCVRRHRERGQVGDAVTFVCYVRGNVYKHATGT